MDSVHVMAPSEQCEVIAGPINARVPSIQRAARHKPVRPSVSQSVGGRDVAGAGQSAVSSE